MHFLLALVVVYLALRHLGEARKTRRTAAVCAALAEAIEAQQARTEERLARLESWRMRQEHEA